jgi:hypothetical protein
MKIKLVSEEREVDLKLENPVEKGLDLAKNSEIEEIKIELPEKLRNKFFLNLDKNEEFQIENLFHTLLLEKSRKDKLQSYVRKKREVEKSLNLPNNILSEVKSNNGNLKRKVSE